VLVLVIGGVIVGGVRTTRASIELARGFTGAGWPSSRRSQKYSALAE